MFPECSIAEFVRGEKVDSSFFLDSTRVSAILLSAGPPGAAYHHILGHVAQTVFFRRYTPGLITALLVVLPYSLYEFHRLFTANLVGGDSLTTSILVGALLLAPLLLAVRQLGKVLAR